MKNKTLLVLAAGMGSRFGGNKQTTPVGPNNELIIDYSIYDAIKYGFNKVVFIIKEENYQEFKDIIGNKTEEKVKVKYVFQKNDNVKEEIEIPKDRVKPLGTAHAILCAKDVINEPFVIINADDFYGADAFKTISDFIDNSTEKDIGVVGYDVINTLTENGSVKRGICICKDDNLLNIDESKIYIENDIIYAESLNTGDKKTISKDTKVSMNMISFNPSIFKLLESEFINFLENADLLNDEFLIPNVVTYSIYNNIYNVKLINTNAVWTGMTYKEDLPKVKEFINKKVEEGEYN